MIDSLSAIVWTVPTVALFAGVRMLEKTDPFFNLPINVEGIALEPKEVHNASTNSNEYATRFTYSFQGQTYKCEDEVGTERPPKAKGTRLKVYVWPQRPAHGTLTNTPLRMVYFAAIICGLLISSAISLAIKDAA